MKLFSSYVILPVILALLFREWMAVTPRVNWKPKTVDSVLSRNPVDVEKLPDCPEGKKPFLVFGATSMLGRYIIEPFSARADLCIISYSRSKCKKCDITVSGDLRDTRYVSHVLDHFKPETIMTSVKPPLMGQHYKVYIELNLLSMVELIKAAKAKGAQNFIYVSSIAAAGHYHTHADDNENHDAPFYTDYEAPYDVSKRFAEDFLLSMHEEGKFNVVSIRTSGIIGGEGDPYDYLRFMPVLGGFDPPPEPIDCNYAANIADALLAVYDTMKANTTVGGQFYYYTGEPISETLKARIVAELTNKPFITLPLWLLKPIIDTLHRLRWDPDTYNYIDILRMGVVRQTFKQEKFHKAFPKFRQKYTMKQALEQIYGSP